MKVKRDVQMMTGRFVAGMMAIVFTLLIILNPIDAEAAARGYGTGSGTITVTTKADWRYPGSESITFKNAKIVFEYSEWGLFRGWRTKTRAPKLDQMAKCYAYFGKSTIIIPITHIARDEA